MIEGQKFGLAEAASPDSEVTPKAKRRSFSALYKKKILAEVEACCRAPPWRVGLTGLQALGVLTAPGFAGPYPGTQFIRG
jgi:hypothetical protein